jgi:hypothetical protein
MHYHIPMEIADPQALRYSLKYSGHPAGAQTLSMMPVAGGSRLVLEAQVELPLPKTRQRWESDIDEDGLPRRYLERVEGGGNRLLQMEFSKSDGLVVVSQGKEDVAVPYLAEMYDPLSLLLAVTQLELEVGEVEMFPMVGGRAYAERLPDQTVALPYGEQLLRVYRLRPGLSLIYLDADSYPVRLTQKVGEHVFEAELQKIERIDSLPPSRSNRGEEPKSERTERPERGDGGNRRRRRRRRYN